MAMHQLRTSQFLPISLEEAWDFFSNPGNLAKITPPDMGFVIQSGADQKMYPGQVIRYTVKPLLGIPMTWVTEIAHVNTPNHFVDTQLYGPYVHWHHQHFFKAVDGGTQMNDILHYQLPLGPLGDFVHWLFVKKRVREIFEYRENVLKKMFGGSQ